jgi:predicted DNA-binding transcriptional regulator AlpA
MAELEQELQRARKVVATLEKAVASQPEAPAPAPELPKPQRFLTADEAVVFLGLRSRASLAYLHNGEDGPPFVRLTARSRVYSLPDLQAWAQSRKATKK